MTRRYAPWQEHYKITFVTGFYIESGSVKTLLMAQKSNPKLTRAPSTVPVAPPVKRGRGRPPGDHAAKRAELIKAAVTVVANEGFSGASLRKVAQHAGCTTGAVTYYFENKEAMISAIADSLFDEWDSYLAATEDDLKSGFERFLNWSNTGGADPWLAGFQLVAHARLDSTFATIYQRRYAQYRQTFAAMLTKGQRRGDIRTDIPADILADQLCAMGDGWMIMFPIEPERFEAKRVQLLLDAMIKLISAKESPPAAEKSRRGKAAGTKR